MSAQPLQLASPAAPEVWVSFNETVELCGRGDQWFCGRVRAGAIRVRDTGRIRRNGRADREVALASLTSIARMRHAMSVGGSR